MSLAALRRNLPRLLSFALAAGFGVYLALNWELVLDSIGRVSVRVVLAVCALQLVSNLARTVSFEMCVRAAGVRTPRRALHLASAVNFLVGSLAPAHAGPPARMWMLSRSARTDAPSAAQMVAADGVLLFLQVAAAAVCMPLLAASSDLAGWVKALLVGGCALCVLVVFFARSRFSHRAWSAQLEALADPLKLTVLFVLNAGALAIQTLRTMLMMGAVGFHLKAIQATVVYALTTLSASPVPIGPGISPIGHHAALRAHGALARGVAGGLLLGLTCALAALCQLGLTMLVSARSRRRELATLSSPPARTTA